VITQVVKAIHQSTMSNEIKPEIVAWTQILLDSYQQLLGKDLILDRSISPIDQAHALDQASFVLVSHGTEPDPILNYGNQMALKLWEMSWDELTATPSRLTAEPVNQEIRQQMLLQVANQGFIDNYQGVRISKSGQRFMIDRAIVWNLTDTAGNYCGQAATFDQWQFVDSPSQPTKNPPVDYPKQTGGLE
jgi:MEKHLA domain